MADNYVTLTTGSKMQTYVNSIASNAVDAEAIVLVNESGNPVKTRNIADTPVDSDTGIITHAVVYGHTTAGGGSYVEVKVAPSGALQTDSSGTTQPVSGPLTDTQLRASNVPVSGTFWQAIQPVSGTVAATESGDWIVKSTNASNFLTTISGTVTANQGGTWNIGTISANVPVTDAGGSLTVDGTVAATQSGTWNIGTITALPANASFNETQVLGTTIDVNAGNASAGTQRVVLASNQPNVPVTDAGGSLTVDGSVSLSANSSFNLNQVLGTTVDVNSGTKSAGTQRVVIATDQPALTNKLLVTPDANSSFNLSQVLGTTVSTAAAGIQKCGVVGSTGTALTESVSGVRDDMPRKRDGATGLSPVYYTGRITTKTTTTVTAATAYVSVMKVLCSNAGTAATLNINDTNRTFFSFNIPGGNMTVGGNYESYTEPIKFTTGINIVTGGTTMGDCNVAITYWQ